MNTYMSYDEKENFIRQTLMRRLVEADVERYAENSRHPDKTYLKYLRTALTWLQKAQDYRNSFLAVDAARSLSRRIDSLEFLVVPKDSAKKQFDKVKEMKSKLHMDIEDFYDWAEMTMPFQCGRCAHEKRYKQCRLRRILMKYDIAPVTLDARDSCQFSYPDAGLKIMDDDGNPASTNVFFDNDRDLKTEKEE